MERAPSPLHPWMEGTLCFLTCGLTALACWYNEIHRHQGYLESGNNVSQRTLPRNVVHEPCFKPILPSPRNTLSQCHWFLPVASQCSVVQTLMTLLSSSRLSQGCGNWKGGRRLQHFEGVKWYSTWQVSKDAFSVTSCWEMKVGLRVRVNGKEPLLLFYIPGHWPGNSGFLPMACWCNKVQTHMDPGIWNVLLTADADFF